jgi:signal transduction histidine kinase
LEIATAKVWQIISPLLSVYQTKKRLRLTPKEIVAAIAASFDINASKKELARQIVEQSHRISDMITALRLFAEPTKPDRKPTELVELLDAVIGDVRKRYDGAAEIKVVVPQGLGPISVDPDQLGRAVMELLRNAVESEGSAQIEVRVQIDDADDRLNIHVTDDGSGLTPHVLAHAFDPFFSAKPAGRQPGLGLAQAQRLVEAHGGSLTLENGHQRGAVATIRLDDWRCSEAPQIAGTLGHVSGSQSQRDVA